MDVQSVIEICSPDMQKVIVWITDTIVPEKYRVVENNKTGILSDPAGICLDQHGSLYVSDSSKGKVLFVRLHYPVDVTEIMTGLDIPLGVPFHNSIIYVCEYGSGQIAYVDIKGDIISNPDIMTCEQLRKALTKRSFHQGIKSMKNCQLQSKLKSIMNIHDDENNNDNQDVFKDHSRRMDKHLIEMNDPIKTPAAVAFDSNGLMCVSDISTSTVTLFSLQHNSRHMKATAVRVIGVQPLVYSIFVHDHVIYTASADIEKGFFLPTMKLMIHSLTMRFLEMIQLIVRKFMAFLQLQQQMNME
ncbi:unnamed protein product [Mytilus edulis]|uniref:Uncharacterized protein n=1 Tax=Mytilus edulis TaxID=6550 RepID=A0A8S3TAE5_MYTED|nr:unnamed protein product [Mytilus edulis]